MSSTKSALIAMAAIIATASLGACHTVEGAGQDAQAAGRAIEETAQETNDGNPATP